MSGLSFREEFGQVWYFWFQVWRANIFLDLKPESQHCNIIVCFSEYSANTT